MEVRRIEQADGTLLHLEFVRGDEADFKDEIKTWVVANLPGMTWQQFFERLEEFRLGTFMRINMT